MFRKLVPLAVAIVLVLGCGKKKDEGSGGEGGTDGDPNATYTLKFRGEQQGDKVDVIESDSMTNENAKAGKSETRTNKKRYEYTEHILEMPAEADKPTKVTRTYRVAERTDFKTKEVKALPFQGKTVTIEKETKKGPNPYKYTIDGKAMDFMDSIDIDSEFRSDKKKNELEMYLPKNPVKVGDTWAVEPEKLKMLAGGIGSAADKSKSTYTCKLTRAYTKDGKQWGIISFDFDMPVDVAVASKGKESGTGSIKFTGTIDGVIDGSARDVSIKATMKASFNNLTKGKEAKGSTEMIIDISVKTVK
jgi:hypothetical protein